MSDLGKIYKDNLSNSHEAALGAIYSAGYAEGFAAALITPAQAAVIEVVAETPNPELPPSE
jgi:hypothetical protein